MNHLVLFGNVRGAFQVLSQITHVTSRMPNGRICHTYHQVLIGINYHRVVAFNVYVRNKLTAVESANYSGIGYHI